MIATEIAQTNGHITALTVTPKSALAKLQQLREELYPSITGVAEITIPRDRQGEFEPHLVKKGQSRLSGLDEKIIALYARGMSVRDIQAQLQEMYGVEVSPTLISNVTDAVIDEVKQCAPSSSRCSLSDSISGLSADPKFETMAGQLISPCTLP